VLTGLAVLLALGLPLFAWAKWGGGATWPGLIGNFTATVLAFLVALSWDRRERRLDLNRQAEDRKAEVSREQNEELNRRREEAMRRLAPLFYELRHDTQALKEIEGQQPHATALPPLHVAAWQTNGPALGALLADYELISELGSFYNEVDDLRWLLRRHLETWHTRARSEPMWNDIVARARRLRTEAEQLDERVTEQHERPTLDRLAVLERLGFRDAATVYLSLTPSGTA
jgi:hypothetical protein